MKSKKIARIIVISALCCTLRAQQPDAAPFAVVPQLVNFSGKAVDAQGYECWAARAAGVRFGRRWIGRSANPGRISANQIVPHWEFQPAAAFHDRENRRDFGTRLWAADVYPVFSTQSHGTHGILCLIIAQFKFRMFQEAREFLPQCERVLAGFAECAGGQCNGLRSFDPHTDFIEERLRSFLASDMARRNTQRFATSFGVDGKQLVHPPRSEWQRDLGDLVAPPRRTVF